MPPPPLIVGLGGSLREPSRSRAALRAALKIAADAGAQTELLDLRELNLPMFIPTISVEEYPAESQPRIAKFLDACRRADAMIWSSPTYHGTVSGAFKNALDFVELMADDASPYLQNRAVGLIVVADRTTFAAMRDCAHELRAWLAPTQVHAGKNDFTAQFELHSERVQSRLTRMVAELLEFSRR